MYKSIGQLIDPSVNQPLCLHSIESKHIRYLEIKRIRRQKKRENSEEKEEEHEDDEK